MSEDWHLCESSALDHRATAAYRRALERCLSVASVDCYFGKRPGADHAAAQRELLRPETVARVCEARDCHRALRAYHDAVARHGRLDDWLEASLSRARWDLRVTCVVLLGIALCVLLVGGIGLPWWPLSTGLLLTLALAWCLAVPSSRARLRANVEVLAAAVGRWWCGRRVREAVEALEESMSEEAMPAVVKDVVVGLLGPDPDCLLVATEYEGIRDPRDQRYVVRSGALEEIRQKLKSMMHGTIAVCGPRGSGKSTLLETCADFRDLRIAVQAPASYVPLEFLTSLFVKVCETYLTSKGARFPEFRRLSPLRMALRRLLLVVRNGGRATLGGLLALVLLALGVFASARDFAEVHVDAAARLVQGQLSGLWEYLLAVMDGHRPWSALLLIALGFFIWEYARWWSFSGTTELVRWWVLRPVGWCLVAVVLVTAWSPRSVVEWVVRWRQTDPLAVWLAAGLVCGAVLFSLAIVVAQAKEDRWQLSQFLAGLFDLVPFLLLTGLLGFVLLDDQMRHVARGWDVAQRAALIALGVLLLKASSYTRNPREPELVTRCRDHLYRLQTVQSVSYGASGGGAAGALALSSTYGTSITASPLTLPELVEELRCTLADIAEDGQVPERRVLVTIDEIDRLGTTAAALEFLGGIKAVLGVTGVHFLISVSEDVGASFVGRGLPARDLVDSTFDDVMHVRPCTLQESTAILERRVRGIPQPFVSLVHALAGGVPRDLIRYSREVMALRKNRDVAELRPLAAWLVAGEMRGVLHGFRSVLKETDLPGDSAAVIHSMTHRLIETLESDPLCRYLCRLAAVKQQIGELIAWADSTKANRLRAELPATAVQRVDQTASYAYFCVTLLDVFAEPDFGRRCTAARKGGPGGQLGSLATAREELSFSPQSARQLISEIRKAWQLPQLLGPGAESPTAGGDAVDQPCNHF